jgi:hypothetical protein
MDEHGKIYLQVQVNNSSKLRFLLDTGAALLCLIDTDVVSNLGLKTKPGYRIIGTGGATQSGAVAGDISFQIPGMSMQHVHAGVVSFWKTESKSKYKDGILGFDIFRNFVVEVNYATRTLSLFLPHEHVYSGKREAVPVEFISNAAYVKAAITFPKLAPIEDIFKVDTGDGSAISFHAPFVKKRDLINNLSIVGTGVNIGLGNESGAFFAYIDKIQVGSVSVGRELISLSTATTGPLSLDNAAGTLGGPFWRHFKVVFDFPESQIVLYGPFER